VRRLHGGALDPELLDFSANVNPLGPPDGVRAVLRSIEDVVARYPSPDAAGFGSAAARHHGIPEECLLPGNGSTDLIYLLANLFRGSRVRVLVPAFTEYEDACLAAAIPVNEGGETVTFLGNPTSPEGKLLPKEEILRTAGTLMIDEAFMDFTDGTESLVREAARDPRLIVIRTLTKLFAIPGLRLGYVVAVPETIRRLRELQPPWTVNALAEAAGVAALEDREFAAFSRRFVAERRAELFRGLRILGLEVRESVANFLLCRVPDAKSLSSKLRKRGIAIRNCDSFTGIEKNRYVRFAVRKRSDNERLLSVLREVYNQCPA
jgi:threonine-phosphate decarboxylase